MASKSSQGKNCHQHARPYVYQYKQHIAYFWCFLAWSHALPCCKNCRDALASKYDVASHKTAEEEQKWISVDGQ